MDKRETIRCWTCVGRGKVSVVCKHGPWDTEDCPDCKGTGVDEEKTREHHYCWKCERSNNNDD